MVAAAVVGTVGVGAVPAAAIGGFCAPHPLRTVSIGDDFVYEHQTAELKVTLSGPACTTIKVSYNTQNGSAKAGSDYVAKSGTLKFAPGVVEATVTVSIIDDNSSELNESFWVKLTSPVNSSIADGWGKVTISGLEPAG